MVNPIQCETFLQIIFLSSTSILFNQHISLIHVRLLPSFPALGGGGESCDEMSLSAVYRNLNTWHSTETEIKRVHGASFLTKRHLHVHIMSFIQGTGLRFGNKVGKISEQRAYFRLDLACSDWSCLTT